MKFNNNWFEDNYGKVLIVILILFIVNVISSHCSKYW